MYLGIAIAAIAVNEEECGVVYIMCFFRIPTVVVEL